MTQATPAATAPVTTAKPGPVQGKVKVPILGAGGISRVHIAGILEHADKAEETDAECEFVDFVQRPQWQLEERMVWLGVAVVAALLVLIVFMIVLAT